MSDAFSIYRYTDYRLLLRDYYAFEKERRKTFSFRAFSQRAGLRAPNHLKRVIDGERPLTLDTASRYAAAMKLSPTETEFFLVLVQFCEATSRRERALLERRLVGFRGHPDVVPLESAQADYHSQWFIPVVRELAVREDFRRDAEWIAPRLVPAISVEQAQHALDVLTRLGLLPGDDRILSTGAQATAQQLRTFHQMMLQHMAAAIDSLPPEERDVTSLTFCVGPDGFERVRAILRRFRQELTDVARDEETRADRVVVVGMQMIPLSTSLDRERGAQS